jgi:hypothetical protein
MNIRRRTFVIIEKSQGNDLASFVFDVSLIILILLNITAVIAASFSGFAAAHAVGLHRFEAFSIGRFGLPCCGRYGIKKAAKCLSRSPKKTPQKPSTGSGTGRKTKTGIPLSPKKLKNRFRALPWLAKTANGGYI